MSIAGGHLPLLHSIQPVVRHGGGGASNTEGRDERALEMQPEGQGG